VAVDQHSVSRGRTFVIIGLVATVALYGGAISTMGIL
jgi:hypothetical protein